MSMKHYWISAYRNWRGLWVGHTAVFSLDWNAMEANGLFSTEEITENAVDWGIECPIVMGYEVFGRMKHEYGFYHMRYTTVPREEWLTHTIGKISSEFDLSSI